MRCLRNAISVITVNLSTLSRLQYPHVKTKLAELHSQGYKVGDQRLSLVLKMSSSVDVYVLSRLSSSQIRHAEREAIYYPQFV